MADRLRWWVIPGAMVVLVRVVTLGPAPADPVAHQDTLAEGTTPMGEIAVLEAAGQRGDVVALGSVATAAMVTLPVAWKGRRGRMAVWRRVEGVREAQPWLEFRPRVRDDATIPITGLAAGHYDLELQFSDPGAAAVFVAHDAVVPGPVVLQPRQ